MTKIFKDGTSQLPQVRCPNCNKLLGKLKGVYEIKCQRCKRIVSGKSPTFLCEKEKVRSRTGVALLSAVNLLTYVKSLAQKVQQGHLPKETYVQHYLLMRVKVLTFY